MLAMACMATAGCGGGGDSDNPSGSTNANTNTSFFEDIPAELDGTTVTFATWIDHNSNESATVLSDFTDITGIKVEILHIPQMEYVSKLSALVASGLIFTILKSVGRLKTSSRRLKSLKRLSDAV